MSQSQTQEQEQPQHERETRRARSRSPEKKKEDGARERSKSRKRKAESVGYMIYHCEITPDLAASRKSLGKVYLTKDRTLRAWFEAEPELLDGVCELLEQRAQQYVAKQKQKMTEEEWAKLDKAQVAEEFKSQYPELKVEKGQKAHEVSLEAIEALLDDHDSHVATVELEELD